MTDPPADVVRIHETHDRLVIAALAADDLAGRDLDRTAALVRDCPDCAELATELRFIADATRRMPTSRHAPRDFRLSPADAERLRARGWRRALRLPVERGWSTRPFAAALTTLGVAGLLLAAVPFMSFAPATGGAIARDNALATSGGVRTAASSAPTAALGAAPAVTPTFTVGPGSIVDAAGSPESGVPGEFGALPNATASHAACCATAAPAALLLTPSPSQAPETSNPVSGSPLSRSAPLMIVSVGLLLAGLALFAARRRSAGGH